MGYERYLQNTDPRGDYDVHDDLGRQRSDRPRSSEWDRGDNYSGESSYGTGRYSSSGERHSGYGRRDQSRYGGADQSRYGGDQGYRGSYASDGRRFTESEDDSGNRAFGGQRDGWNSYGERPDRGGQGYQGGQDRPRGVFARGSGNRQGGQQDDDRGFFARAGDEVRAWFGDEDAECRREQDQRSGGGSGHHDHDYHSWRRSQIDALDRDYHEYRQENQNRFHTEFSNWRTERQTQRDGLNKVEEHMEVVGSDGEHVGTVDKVRGDRIILTKSDENAGGHQHSIPSRWIDSIDDKVKIRKTAAEAVKHWKDEERSQDYGSGQGSGQGSFGQGNGQGNGQGGYSQGSFGASADRATTTSSTMPTSGFTANGD